MRRRLIIEINGGVLHAVYGDALPENIELDVILRDMDNINDGDADPLTEQDKIDKEQDMIYYW